MNAVGLTRVLLIGFLCSISFAATAADGVKLQVHKAALNAGAFRGLDLAVLPKCEQENVSFKVQNHGEKWQSTATFSIYDVGRGRKVFRRDMKMTYGQMATFAVDRATVGQGSFLLVVEPLWVSGKTYRVEINC